MRRTHAQAIVADRILAFGGAVPARSQQHPSRTNAQSSVSPASLQMQCKLHLQKPGWYKKQSPALGICLHPMQLDYKAHVLKQLSRHDYWLRPFSVDFAQKTLQRQIRMQVVFLATLRTGIYEIRFHCKFNLTYPG